MKTVYIAGPMRGKKWYNFPAFDAATWVVASQGFATMNPAEMDRQAGFDAMKLPEGHDWNSIPAGFNFGECVDRDLRAIRRCDAIYLLKGWQDSTGARAEKALAEWLGLEIMYEDDEDPQPIRKFDTGATRNSTDNKLDYEGFLAPSVLQGYAQYMHEHRKQRDGTIRDSDNWQKGIPIAVYTKSLIRHTFDLWAVMRGLKRYSPEDGHELTKTELCYAIMFNAMGLAFELLKEAK